MSSPIRIHNGTVFAYHPGMASLREKRWKDGTTTTWQVRWREADGTQTSESFDDKDIAVAFKSLVETVGPDAAYEWLDSRAETAAAGDTLTLNEWMIAYIGHLTGITSGTRAKYLREVWPRYAKAPSAESGPALGSLPIDLVTRQHVAWATNSLASRFSPKSIKNSRGLLYAGFKAAVDDPHLPVAHNPVKGIKLPGAGEADEDQKMFLTLDEFVALYAQIPDYWKPLTLTLVGTGMRYGEATALQVRDLDLRYDPDTDVWPELRVARAWKHSHTDGWTLGAPKTRKSRRAITLPLNVAALLRPLVEGRKPDEFVFLNRRGAVAGPVRHSSYYQKVWLPAVRRAIAAGRLTRRPRIHDLRHTHVSWLIRAGIDLPSIQERLGHESITTTIDIYGGLQPDMRIRAAAAAGSTLTPVLEAEPRPRELPAAEHVA